MTKDRTKLAALKEKLHSEATPELCMWDISELARRAESLAAHDCDAAALEKRWESLKSEKTAERAAAFCKLLLTLNETTAMLKRILKPVPASNADDLASAIAKLDSANFAERENAYRQILSAGEPGLVLASQTLKNRMVPEETRCRLKSIIEAREWEKLTSELVRAVRAIDLLEQLNTDQSRDLLRAIAHGDPLSWLTMEAWDSLNRLQNN